MAAFSGRAGAAVKDFAVNHNAGAYACADGRIENIFITAGRSPTRLGQGSSVRVIIQFDGDGVKLLQGCGERKTSPARHIWRIEDYSGCGIQRTRSTDTNTLHAIGIAIDGVGDRGDDRLDALFC